LAADGTARVWDAMAAREIAVLQGHEGFVNSAAYCSVGSRIVTASADQTARIWDNLRVACCNIRNISAILPAKSRSERPATAVDD
jgi:WD40 repeat protein